MGRLVIRVFPVLLVLLEPWDRKEHREKRVSKEQQVPVVLLGHLVNR